MKPHKHAKLIKAWADGAKIQVRFYGNDWQDIECNKPLWITDYEYRIKPEPKPDVILYASWFRKTIGNTTGDKDLALCWQWGCDGVLSITMDGETGKLKAAEVLK